MFLIQLIYQYCRITGIDSNLWSWTMQVAEIWEEEGITTYVTFAVIGSRNSSEYS